MIRYEENKVELSGWLSWVLKILLLLLFFVFIFTFFNTRSKDGIWGSAKRYLTSPFNWFSWSH